MEATLTNAILSNPVLGAAGTVLAIVLLQWLRQWVPGLGPGSDSKRAGDADPPRTWQGKLVEGAEALEGLVDELRRQGDLKRREVECLERVERSLLELLARERAAASGGRARVRPSE